MVRWGGFRSQVAICTIHVYNYAEEGSHLWSFHATQTIGMVRGVLFPCSCPLRPVLHRFQATDQLKHFLHRSWQLKSMHALCTKCTAIHVKISRKVCSTTKLNVLGRNKMRTLDSKQTSPTAYYTRYYQDQNVSFKLRQDLCIFSFAITISTFFIFTQSATP